MGSFHLRRWATFVLLIFALHLGWEMAPGKWWDLVITAVAFAVAAVVAKNAAWPVGRHAVIATTACFRCCNGSLCRSPK